MKKGAERALLINAAREGFERSMAKIQASVYDGTQRGLTLWASHTIMQVIAKHIAGRPGLISRTGTLIRSLMHRESGEKIDNLKTEFYVGDPKARYAFIQEFGGVVKSKRPGGYLAIPLPGAPNTLSTGGSEVTGPLRQTLPPGFHVVKTKKGNLLLGHEVNGAFEAWFVLKKSVKIPARLKFRETVKRSIVTLQRQLRGIYGEAAKNG